MIEEKQIKRGVKGLSLRLENGHILTLQKSNKIMYNFSGIYRGGLFLSNAGYKIPHKKLSIIQMKMRG